MELTSLIDKAKTSKMRLWLLNRLLYKVIPFNKPHKFQVSSIGEDNVTIMLPYKKQNFNHIRGLHACALATLAEYTTGFMMIRKLNAKTYRIIMQRLEMDYHFQGKSAAYCSFGLRDEKLNKEILNPLKFSDSVVFTCEPKIYDENKNHLATAKVHWQVKSWEKVRTKL